MIAGSADVISFRGWGGLFVTHVTGNLAILAAHLVTGNRTGVGLLLSVPAVVLVLAFVAFKFIKGMIKFAVLAAIVLFGAFIAHQAGAF